MSKMAKKDLLLDATMRLVAENGLMSLSMQMVTKMAGTAEGLIYKHYQTKENLLLQCYLHIYKEIRECIEDDSDIIGIGPQTDLYAFLHDLWIKYFDYFLQSGYKALYFYEYRNSSYMKTATQNGDINPKEFFRKTAENFFLLDEKFHILSKTDLKSFFMYVTDLTLTFVVRIINGDGSCDDAKRENIWSLLWGGESWLLNQ